MKALVRKKYPQAQAIRRRDRRGAAAWNIYLTYAAPHPFAEAETPRKAWANAWDYLSNTSDQ